MVFLGNTMFSLGIGHRNRGSSLPPTQFPVSLKIIEEKLESNSSEELQLWLYSDNKVDNLLKNETENMRKSEAFCRALSKAFDAKKKTAIQQALRDKFW